MMAEDQKNNKIEVEFRSVFDENKYYMLQHFLSSNPDVKDLGEDNKDVFFFLLPSKLLKVVNNLTKGTAKLVLKLNRIGKGSDFEEIEIPINPQDFEKAIKLFTLLGFTEVQNTYQKRHNYLYKGVELALKYSNTWGYHLELEIVVNSKDQIEKAGETIKKLAEELGVKVMTDEELAKLVKTIDANYKKGLYDKRHMGLFEQAAQGILPKTQYMDKKTLDWIKENKPGYLTEFTHASGPSSKSNLVGIVGKYNPEDTWFQSDELINTIHGRRHILRVVANVIKLLVFQGLNVDEGRNIIIAAALHDLRRQDDKGDPDHGKRAAEWFRENTGLVSKQFGVNFSDKDINEVCCLVTIHEVPYEKIKSSPDYLIYKRSADTLKTADALDRYRLPKLKWWVNDQLIVLVPPIDLKLFAYKLVVSSETNFLIKNMDSKNSTIEALKTCGSRQ